MTTTRPPTSVIDTHRHYLSASLFPEGVVDPGKSMVSTWKGLTTELPREIFDLEEQIRTQDEAGVTKGLLSFSIVLENMSEQGNVDSALMARRFNDDLARAVATHPDKLDFLGVVNPFDAGAIEECERCLDQLGAKGISVPSSWNGVFLDAPAVDSFWAYAASKGAPVHIHPPTVPIGYQAMNAYKLEEMVGRPFDTTMNIARMIYSGVFDRYPSLQVVLVHIGGGFMDVLGRLDFGYRLGYDYLPSGQRAVCRRRPSAYLRSNIYVDTMGLNRSATRQAVELFGADRVVLGSDYPAVPLSPREHIDIVQELGLSSDDEENILWRNAAELFGLHLPLTAASAR